VDVAKWTVMVFMCTAHPTLDRPLTKEATADINEMKKIAVDDSLDIFVQRHDKASVKRFHIKGPDTQTIDVDDPEDRDILGGKALGHFITWSLNTAEHNAAQDYTLLVLWGHAFHFGVS